ncbi:MAG: hypothetical protein AAF641_08650 [Pseudomonadota bacterium]
MVRRCLLTEDYIDNLAAPQSGEIWIADTRVRGFGLRIWSSKNSNGSAFAIRVSDTKGRSVRKTFDPWKHGRQSFALHWAFRDPPIDENGHIKLSAFLEPARDWARTEIGRLKGRLPSEEELTAAEMEHEEMLSSARNYIKTKTLGEICDKVLNPNYSASRGWTEEYADRLAHAFYQFDREANVRNITFSELEDGRLTDLIEGSTLSPGNLRHLRSLLNVVLWNVHNTGGPVIGNVFPGSRGLQTRSRSSVLDEFELGDYQEIIEGARHHCEDWRASTCIELCFYFWAPISRVMSGRWIQIRNGRWYPYSSNELSTWRYRWSNIDAPEFDCLMRAYQAADTEDVLSDFFFPSPLNSTKPISNIDRSWALLLRKLGLPNISLKQCSTRYRRKYPFLTWPDLDERGKIAAKLSKLPPIQKLTY